MNGSGILDTLDTLDTVKRLVFVMFGIVKFETLDSVSHLEYTKTLFMYNSMHI